VTITSISKLFEGDDANMKNRRNYYRILQVQPDAPIELIRSSYRTLMRELKQHPDLGGSSSNAQILNEAYEVLGDPDRRANYDKDLFKRYTKRDFSPTSRPASAGICPFCKKPLTRKPLPGQLCVSCRSPLQSKNKKDLEQAYRRSTARTKKKEVFVYYSSWPGRAQEAEMVDFSPKGMRFLCSECFVKGTVLKIRSRLFDASASVTNCREEKPQGSMRYAVGVSFMAISFLAPRGVFFSASA